MSERVYEWEREIEGGRVCVYECECECVCVCVCWPFASAGKLNTQ